MTVTVAVVLAAACIVVVLAVQAVVVARLRARDGGRSAPRQAEPAAVPAEGGGAVVGALRRHRWLRRSLSFASVAAMLVAVGIVGFPFYTNLYADRLQARLERQFASEELRQQYVNCREVGLDDESCRIDDGDSLTRIVIPDIRVDVVVVEGVSDSALRAGAGHYPSTPLPCESGNVAIAGHRTTYGKPFHNLDLLEPGDEIILQIPIGECVYRVTEQRVVSPSDVGVIAATADDRLTLTTCHPKGSARQRLIITAVLAETRLSA